MRVTMNGVVDVIDIQRTLLPRNRTNFNSLATTLILKNRHEFPSGCDGHDVRGYNGGQSRDTNSTNDKRYTQ